MRTRDFQNTWDLPKVIAKRSHSFRFLLFNKTKINDLISSQESRKELKSLFQKVEDRIS